MIIKTTVQCRSTCMAESQVIKLNAAALLTRAHIMHCGVAVIDSLLRRTEIWIDRKGPLERTDRLFVMTVDRKVPAPIEEHCHIDRQHLYFDDILAVELKRAVGQASRD